jgi:uncharacterized membrane protein
MPEMLYVLAAAYDDVDDALTEYRAIEGAWSHVSSAHTLALGAVAGHTAGSLSRDDLKRLGEVLDEGDAGLVVVYPQDMTDRVLAAVTRAKNKVHASAGVSGDELAAEVRAAEERSAAPSGA